MKSVAEADDAHEPVDTNDDKELDIVVSSEGIADWAPRGSASSGL